MERLRTFASDNWAGVHPEVMRALRHANDGPAPAYGKDVYTKTARDLFQQEFGDCEVFFVSTGTSANILSLASMTKPHQAILCADTAHIHTSENGAVERFTGCKIIPIPSKDGKVTAQQIESRIPNLIDPHTPRPRVVSITQATEYGTVYTPKEIRTIADTVHGNGLLLHMDGARLANAAAHLGAGLREVTGDCGVDIATFGGTKNGAMCAEAIVSFREGMADELEAISLQGGQLASKMRYFAIQFYALFQNDLWRRNAKYANAMAGLLAQKLEKIPGVTLTQSVDSNAVFAQMLPDAIPHIQERFPFHVWNEETSEVRLMTSFETRKKDVEEFVACVREEVGRVLRM